MKTTRCLAALALALVSSCSDGLSLGPNAINGRWVSVDQAPGMSLHIIFLTHSDSVTGSGDWTGEAILGGDVTATGQVSGRLVALDLTFEHRNNGVPIGTSFTEHFAGAFTSNSDLEGTTTLDGSQGQLHLRRLTGP
ncbi:MAG TPA: hypothetical protein VJO33_10190 [Gemmatimonadaceae bacterium]|nr:hypothetical protein [Gemmatimonadaceae bacterium]